MNRGVQTEATDEYPLEDDYAEDEEYEFTIDRNPDNIAYTQGEEDYELQRVPNGRTRAFALGGSLLLLLVVFSLVMFLLSARAGRQARASSGNAASAQASGNTAGLDQAPYVGALAPDFSLVDVHTNQQVKLSSLRGKPVFINFWGTWCPPCRAEMPEMRRLYDKYPGQLQIVGVTMGPRDYPEQVKTFVDQYKYPWTFIHDADYAVATNYQVQAIPSSFFIDKDGVIRGAQVGAMSFEVMEANFQKVQTH